MSWGAFGPVTEKRTVRLPWSRPVASLTVAVTQCSVLIGFVADDGESVRELGGITVHVLVAVPRGSFGSLVPLPFVSAKASIVSLLSKALE